MAIEVDESEILRDRAGQPVGVIRLKSLSIVVYSYVQITGIRTAAGTTKPPKGWGHYSIHGRARINLADGSQIVAGEVLSIGGKTYTGGRAKQVTVYSGGLIVESGSPSWEGSDPARLHPYSSVYSVKANVLISTYEPVASIQYAHAEEVVGTHIIDKIIDESATVVLGNGTEILIGEAVSVRGQEYRGSSTPGSAALCVFIADDGTVTRDAHPEMRGKNQAKREDK